MKYSLLFACLFASSVCHAELVTAEEHQAWVQAAMKKCAAIESTSDRLACRRAAPKLRKAEGLSRGTAEYVQKQFASMTDEQIKEQISLDEEAMRTAETIYVNAEVGELLADDYLVEITAANDLLAERASKQDKSK